MRKDNCGLSGVVFPAAVAVLGVKGNLKTTSCGGVGSKQTGNNRRRTLKNQQSMGGDGSSISNLQWSYRQQSAVELASALAQRSEQWKRLRRQNKGYSKINNQPAVMYNDSQLQWRHHQHRAIGNRHLEKEIVNNQPAAMATAMVQSLA